MWLGELPVAVLRASGTLYVAPDQLGAPWALIGGGAGASQVSWLWDHDPFGNGAPSAAAGVAYNPRFPGQYYDALTGLHYNGARDYNPKLGRYIESDPIGLQGGNNTYAYADGNPVSRVDPTGEAGMYITFPGYSVDIGVCSVPLTHAGVIAIDNNTGSTKYFDFGRYGGQYGDIRGPYDVGIVAFDLNGKATAASLHAVASKASLLYGKGVSPTYVYNNSYSAAAITNFAINRRADLQQHPYTLNPLKGLNTCVTFASEAFMAGAP